MALPALAEHTEQLQISIRIAEARHGHGLSGTQAEGFIRWNSMHCKQKVTDFPVPSRDVSNQTLPGRDLLIIPDQGEFG